MSSTILINGKKSEVNPYAFVFKLRHKHKLKKEFILTPLDLNRDQLDNLINNVYKSVDVSTLPTLSQNTMIAYQRRDNGAFRSDVVIIEQTESKDGDQITLVSKPNMNNFVSQRQRGKANPHISPYIKYRWFVSVNSIAALYVRRDDTQDSLDQLQNLHVDDHEIIKKIITQVNQLRDRVKVLEAQLAAKNE